MKKQDSHIKIQKLENNFVQLSIYGDALTLTTMLFNAMKNNRYLADVVMETVLFYTTFENEKSSLN